MRVFVKLKFKYKEHSSLLSLIAKCVDVILYLVAAMLGFYSQFHHLAVPHLFQVAIIIGVLLIIPVFSTFGVYQSLRGRSFLSYARSLYFGLAVIMILMTSIAFITKMGELFSRAWFLYWNFYAVIFLTLFRLGLSQFLHQMRKHGHNQKHIVVIGSCDEVADIIQHVHGALWTGYAIDLILDADLGSREVVVDGVRARSLPNKLGQFIEECKADEVWLVSSSWDQSRIKEIMQELQHNVVTIRYFPIIFGMEVVNHSISELLGFPVINIISSPMTGVNRIIKSFEDKVLSLLILLILSPVLLLIAILVKLSSPGPVFYRQKRISWNGKEFEMLKFRSMPVDAEAKSGAVWAKATDNRATKIGSLLRKTSLDELPQFINVLKGDMSIVGPRPERSVFVDQFKREIPAYMQKHLVKAGITGWAQVNGWRGNTDLKKRIEFDLYYINHWSLWFDIKIIFLTIFHGFVNKNAY